MTVKAILDTDILSEYFKGHNASVAARAASYAKDHLPDWLIAAVAVRMNRPLVTGNTDDFVTIQKTGVNLTIENWR